GCIATGPGTFSYVFANWQEVLAMVYGGQNHAGAMPAPRIPDATFTLNPVAASKRDPRRVNCAGCIRPTLLHNRAAPLGSNGNPLVCRTQTCLRLKHAFRLSDDERVTALFLALIKLPLIAPPTTRSVANMPAVDASATSNPFCNAGERQMNQGDSDYLD